MEIVSQDCITGYIKGPPSRPLRRRGRYAIRRSPFRAAALDALVAIPTLPLDQGVMSKPGEESPKFRVLSFTESLGEDIGDLLMCVNILQFHISILYLFSEPVVFEIEVLGSFGEAGVSRDFNARL